MFGVPRDANWQLVRHFLSLLCVCDVRGPKKLLLSPPIFHFLTLERQLEASARHRPKNTHARAGPRAKRQEAWKREQRRRTRGRKKKMGINETIKEEEKREEKMAALFLFPFERVFFFSIFLFRAGKKQNKTKKDISARCCRHCRAWFKNDRGSSPNNLGSQSSLIFFFSSYKMGGIFDHPSKSCRQSLGDFEREHTHTHRIEPFLIHLREQQRETRNHAIHPSKKGKGFLMTISIHPAELRLNFPLPSKSTSPTQHKGPWGLHCCPVARYASVTGNRKCDHHR